MDYKLSFLDRGEKWDNASDVTDVVQQILQVRNLQTLELRGNTLGVEAGEAIAEALKRHPELKHCLWGDLFTTRLRDEIPRTVTSLCAAMIYANASITELDLSDNAFGPIGAESIKDFLESPSAYSLKVLKLNNCGLGSGGQTVAASLIKCHQLAAKSGRKFELKTFSACRNRLENPGAKALAEAFKVIRTLERIILYQNGINAPGIIALAESFRMNPELREIDLSDNTATEKGSYAISKALPPLRNLQSLILADCLCRDAGCHAIVDALNPEIHINLNVVNLSGAELTPEAAVLIAPKMEKFDDVSLKIGCNNFGRNFNTLRDWVPPFVDCGESEDDCGTLDDDEERQSDFDDEEADEEETESSMSEDENKTFDESFKQLAINDINQRAGTSLSFLGGGAKWDNASDVSNVVQQILQVRNLQTLELRGNTLGVEAGEAIAEALKRHPELKHCLWGDLFTTRLRDEIPRTVKSLCAAMIYANASITELDLSDNAFGPIGAESIKDFLESPSAYSLKVLKLNNCGLGSGGQTVAASLIKCHQLAAKSGRKLELKVFSACRNRLENPGAKALAEAFMIIKTLEEIILYQNGINAPGIIALAGSFQMNPNLREIDLSDNTATEKGSYAISKALPSLRKLQSLILADCLCRDAGCHAIVDALDPEVHTDLNVVNLSGAELTPEAAVSIAPKMEKFDDVSLKIGCNNFGHQFEKLRDSMPSFVDCGEAEDDCGTLDDDEECRSEPDEDETNDSLMAGTSNTPATAIMQELDDVFKQMNVEDVEPSNEPILANTTLSFLGGAAKWNNTSDVVSVAQQISQFRNLQTLELRGNTLGVEAGEAIAEALKRHPELKHCLWGDLFTTRLRDEIPRTVKSLCAAMIYANASITELDLSDNAFGPIGAESIKDFLESPSAYSLKVLKLNNCGLGSGGQTVAASLIKCHQLAARSGRKFELKTFSACRNRLENPGAKALAEAFKTIGTLEEIILYQNGINPPGIIMLAESFQMNPKLREIDLSDNTATEKGSYAISKALPSLRNLQSLILADCLCRDAGCHAIVDALNPEIHINLNVVNLSGAELTPEAAVLIAPKMEKFDDVSLNIGCNNFGRKFNTLRDWMPSFVDCGESEDDCGTLDDDEEERSDSDEEE